jgi:hypothetical protein
MFCPGVRFLLAALAIRVLIRRPRAGCADISTNNANTKDIGKINLIIGVDLISSSFDGGIFFDLNWPLSLHRLDA